MMRLPQFKYHAARTGREAAELRAVPGGAMLVAGGTDLLPNMKRRQQEPPTLIGLRRIDELRTIHPSLSTNERLGFAIGPGRPLTEPRRDSAIRQSYGALWQAASQVATPHLRN